MAGRRRHAVLILSPGGVSLGRRRKERECKENRQQRKRPRAEACSME
jgi:hypothetical protein